MRWAIHVHGAAPLLYRRLEGTGLWRQLSPELRAYLARQYERNGGRVARMIAELGRVLEAAESAGIAIVPLKGAALVCHYYEDPALRPMADLDLLVRPEDEAGLIERLEPLGWSPARRTRRHLELRRTGGGDTVVDWHGEHPENPYGLDLHTRVDEALWGLGYPLTETLWQRSRPARFGSGVGLLADPAALLEHLLAHASHDMRAGKFRWIQLHDAALVGRRLTKEDWAVLGAAGASRGPAQMLWAPLRLAERYVGPVAPPEVTERLAQGTPRGLRGRLDAADARHLSYCNPRPIGLGEKLSWYRPGLERLRGLRAMAIPGPGELEAFYPGARSARLPVYYGAYALRAAGWLVRRALRGRRRAWPYG